MRHPVRVVLADDHPMVRKGLQMILDASEEVEVVAQACSGRELVNLVELVDADVAVVDLEMPDVDGFEAVQTIRDRHPQIRCIVLTVHDEGSYVQKAAVAGATGYLLKTEIAENLVKGIMTVADGRAALDPSVTRYLIHEIAEREERNRSEPPNTALSPREHDVLQAMADGMSTKQIAAKLGIGPQTVKTHIAHIYSKMGTPDRTRAVARALRQGLVS